MRAIFIIPITLAAHPTLKLCLMQLFFLEPVLIFSTPHTQLYTNSIVKKIILFSYGHRKKFKILFFLFNGASTMEVKAL